MPARPCAAPVYASVCQVYERGKEGLEEGVEPASMRLVETASIRVVSWAWSL
jgi:hypothetical protein